MTRSGASLAEAVMVLALTGLLLAVVARYAHQLNELNRTRAAALARDRELETARTVLHAELRYLAPRHDLAVLSEDSVAGRFFRGSGTICGPGPRVRYRGLRLPDPDKDSLLFAGDEARSFPIGGAATATCPDGSPALRLDLDTAADRGVILVFERGSYHLAGNGLRYRIGRAGRQPLTGALDPAGAHLAALTAGGDTIGLVVAGNGPPRRLHTLRFLNLSPP